jgi:hypothetical protein
MGCWHLWQGELSTEEEDDDEGTGEVEEGMGLVGLVVILVWRQGE